jgi:hypothetical protein
VIRERDADLVGLQEALASQIAEIVAPADDEFRSRLANTETEIDRTTVLQANPVRVSVLRGQFTSRQHEEPFLQERISLERRAWRKEERQFIHVIDQDRSAFARAESS